METHFLREAFQRPSLWRSLRQSLNLVFSLRLHAQACYTCAMDGTGLYPLPRTPPSVARGAYRPFGAFRLVLALMVVLQHLQYLLPDALRGPFHRMGFGALAVGVFFALSGFIVAEANDRFYAGRPWAFLLNRLLRVVPPYLAALAISAAVQAVLWRTGRLALWDFVLGRDPLDPALLAAGVLSLLPGFHTSYVAQDFEYIPFVWTLRVEMAFYLVAVAVAASMSWAGRQAGRVRGQVPAAAVAAGFAGFALYLWRGGPGLLSDVPFFLLGVCLYAALRRPGLWRGAAVLLAAGCAMAAFPHWDQRGLPALSLQLPALSALIAAMAVLAAWPHVAPSWRRLDRRMGALSYPLYLNHYAVDIALYDSVPARGVAIYAAGAGLSVALAWLMHRLVEAPMDRLRTRVRGRAV